MVNYTYSKAMDDVGTFRVTDNPRLDRSLSVTDQPEHLTATAVYQSPFGKGKAFGAHKLVNAVGGGWIISTGLYNLSTGEGGRPLPPNNFDRIAPPLIQRHQRPLHPRREISQHNLRCRMHPQRRGHQNQPRSLL